MARGRNGGPPRCVEGAGQGWGHASGGEEGGLPRQTAPRSGERARDGVAPPPPEPQEGSSRTTKKPSRHLRGCPPGVQIPRGARAGARCSAGCAAASPRGVLPSSRRTARRPPFPPDGPRGTSAGGSACLQGQRRGAPRRMRWLRVESKAQGAGAAGLSLGYQAAATQEPPSPRPPSPFLTGGSARTDASEAAGPDRGGRALLPQPPPDWRRPPSPPRCQLSGPGVQLRRTPTTFPLPSSPLEVKNWSRAPHQHLSQRTRRDAASKLKKFKTANGGPRPLRESGGVRAPRALAAQGRVTTTRRESTPQTTAGRTARRPPVLAEPPCPASYPAPRCSPPAGRGGEGRGRGWRRRR